MNSKKVLENIDFIILLNFLTFNNFYKQYKIIKLSNKFKNFINKNEQGHQFE